MHNFTERGQAIDLTVAFPKAACHVRAAARTAGSAATALEKLKYVTYGAICKARNIDLRPLGLDVYGAVGRSGLSWIRELAMYHATRFSSLPHEEEQRIYERLTIALHILQARIISTRLVV